MSSPASATGIWLITKASFTITCNNDNVLLHWQTAQEINTSHFEIQSSADGITWAAIGVVAASGNSGIAVNYQFTNAVTDKKYYRLKMVDKDGQFTFSPVRNVSCAGKNWLITAYPNPATDKIELIINGVKRNSLPVKIVNASGQLVWQQQVTLTNQYSKLTVPLTQLAAGIYFIKIEDAEYKQTITINKQ